MIISLSPDLKKESIFANGNELSWIMGMNRDGKKRIKFWPENKKKFVCSFNDPVLLTDSYRIGKMSPTLRDTLFLLYASRPRIVEYDGVSVFWDDTHKGVWCPSIDTLFFAKTLRKIFEKKGYSECLEIGCGSGFLSKYVLAKNKELKKMTIIDIDRNAIKCAKDNIEDKRANFIVGDALKKIKGKKFDLIIFNPPYIPRPKSIDDNPFEGISALYHMIHEGQNYLKEGGIMITNISNLATKIVFSKKPRMMYQKVDSMEIPLKVCSILNDKQWMEYLLKKGLKIKNKGGYNYWHQINMLVFKNI